MKRQAVARTLARRMQARVELEASLGSPVLPTILPPRRDLTRRFDDEAGADTSSARAAAPPPKEPAPAAAASQKRLAPAPRGERASVDELGRAAGVGEQPILDLPPVADKAAALAELAESVRSCTRCELFEDRQHVVFGEGNPDAELVFVGEAPGRDEDRTGRPFVGRAGELLTAMIEKGMGRPRESVYVCNILKCRPPSNRDPEPDEVRHCVGYLHEQLRILRPRLIIALGRISAQILSGERLSLRKLRGRMLTYRGIPLLATYHPAYLLRMREREGRGNPADRGAWEDLKTAMAFLETGATGG
jgi:DNA polymerase